MPARAPIKEAALEMESPALRSHDNSAGLPTPLDERVAQVSGQRESTVLFVEDDLANIRLMERLFKQRPQARLITSTEGRHGLSLAREHSPDLILLDRNLAGLSGEEVLLNLRQDPAFERVPVVMISGDAIPSQVQRMLDLGADAYVTKPFDVHEILDLIDSKLHHRKR